VAVLEACNKGVFKGVSLVGEGSSGRKVNISKNRRIGVGVSNSDIEHVAESLSCAWDRLHFMYLGLPVRKNMRTCGGWNKVVDRLNVRLSAWNAKNLSIGGRFTLVKAVLGNLPIYYLSLFKAPHKILDRLESIRRRFFWGFKDLHQGICWIKWDSILLDDSLGGLGVGSISAKNLSLLAKWKWRFLTETNALWCIVIKCFKHQNTGFSLQKLVPVEGEDYICSKLLPFWLRAGQTQVEFVGSAKVYQGCLGLEESLELVGWDLATPTYFHSSSIKDVALGNVGSSGWPRRIRFYKWFLFARYGLYGNGEIKRSMLNNSLLMVSKRRTSSPLYNGSQKIGFLPDATRSFPIGAAGFLSLLRYFYSCGLVLVFVSRLIVCLGVCLLL
ncbi:hypothetical protein Tco_1287745, partial [Tanacetum coccineum]